MVKKVITIMLIFVMCLSTFSFNNASAEEPVVSEDGNVIFTTLVLTNTYSKVKVEYRDTGLVEYIESVLENGKFVNYVVSSDNERQHKVEAVGDAVYVDGKYFGGEISNDVEADIPNEYDINATTWKYLSTSYGNSSWKYANATIIAAAIATVLGVPPGTSLVLSIAMTFLGLELKIVYWKRYNYKDAKSNYNTCKRAHNTYFYKYSNYTGFIRSTGIVAEWIDPCNSG